MCHRCSAYANKHFNGALICRRGSIADYLIPLIPLFSNLPQPDDDTKGWNLRSIQPHMRVSTFSDLLAKENYPPNLQKHDIRQNTLSTALFRAMDRVILASADDPDMKYGSDFHSEVEVLRQLRLMCCLLFDCVEDVLTSKPDEQEKIDLIGKLKRTNLEMREWYDELDNAVFDWKSRLLDLSIHPMKKWNTFFAICSMLLMERLTVMLTRSWAHATGNEEESNDDEAADTLCALVELKFHRQSPAQHHFVSMLLDDNIDEALKQSNHPIIQLTATTCDTDLRKSMGFLKETKGFETWKWLYEQFGDAGTDQDQQQSQAQDRKQSPSAKIESDSEDSDTIQVLSLDDGDARKDTSRQSSIDPHPNKGETVLPGNNLNGTTIKVDDSKVEREM